MNITIPKYHNNLDPANLEKDVKENIYLKLSTQDLGKIATVSQKWKSLSEEKIFWMSTNCNLSGYYEFGKCNYKWEQEGRSYLRLEDVNVEEIKVELSLLKVKAIEAVKYLSESVKSVEWFCAAGINLQFFGKAGTLGLELNKKLNILEEVKTGFISNLKLYR